jgi:hypothetical protein
VVKRRWNSRCSSSVLAVLESMTIIVRNLRLAELLRVILVDVVAIVRYGECCYRAASHASAEAQGNVVRAICLSKVNPHF